MSAVELNAGEGLIRIVCIYYHSSPPTIFMSICRMQGGILGWEVSVHVRLWKAIQARVLVVVVDVKEVAFVCQSMPKSHRRRRRPDTECSRRIF